MEVLTGPERRRRWSAEEKAAMVRESLEPGKTVSMVARQHGVNPNQLFHWKKLYLSTPTESCPPGVSFTSALTYIRTAACQRCPLAKRWCLLQSWQTRSGKFANCNDCSARRP